jgi:hypothetical protein
LYTIVKEKTPREKEVRKPGGLPDVTKLKNRAVELI